MHPVRRLAGACAGADLAAVEAVLAVDVVALLDPDQAQQLVVSTATPGTESAEKLALLSVLGAQQL